MRIKMDTVVPKMGTVVHLTEEGIDYRKAMAMALHEALGSTNRAIKMAMRWTGASERTVKCWFVGEREPSGDHLIALARHSDAVLFVLLALAGRRVLVALIARLLALFPIEIDVGEDGIAGGLETPPQRIGCRPPIRRLLPT